MPLWMSILFSGMPAVLGWVGLYKVYPALDQAGLPLILNYMISMVAMFPILLLAALIAYHLEGREFSLSEMKSRFRIHQLNKREWRWTLGLLVIFVGGQLLLMPTAKWLTTVVPISLPQELPSVLDPRIVRSAIPSEFLGVTLRDNWGIALLYLTILVFNIFGEELWWRGIILPRQELVHGRWTWLLHGILWTLFHAPFWWNLITILPSTLSLSFVTSRLKNTTPGIIAHFCMNGLGFLLILGAVLGIGT